MLGKGRKLVVCANNNIPIGTQPEMWVCDVREREVCVCGWTMRVCVCVCGWA